MNQPEIYPANLPGWARRSPAVAAMLNPALIAAILVAATEEYVRLRDESLPAAHAFLIPPLVLHRATREELPRSVTSHWPKWVADHPVLVAGFPARAVALREYVREGLRFAVRYGALSIDVVGGLTPAHSPAPSRRPSAQGDVRQVIAASQRVGRWLTKLDLPATAFALLGVRP